LVFATSGYAKDTFHAIKLGQQGDLTDSEYVVWSLDRGTPYVPCPMLWGNEIYLLEDRSFFSCLGAVDGKRHYFKRRLPGVPNFSASSVGAADRIYLLSEEGQTVAVARSSQLKILAANSSKSYQEDMRITTQSTPATWSWVCRPVRAFPTSPAPPSPNWPATSST